MTGKVIQVFLTQKRKTTKSVKKAGILTAALFVPLMLLASCGKKTENTDDTEQTTEATTQEDPDLEKAGAFAGEWTDEENDAILDIWVSEDAVCHGEIIVKHSENELTFWSFSGTIVEEEMVYLDCERVDAHYDESGNVEEESVYTRGRGKIGFSGKNLFWIDSKEDAGTGMVFTYYGEY